jgi:hypothetical protein
MSSQLEPIFKLQLLIWQGWMRVTVDSLSACQRLLEHQAKIFDHPSYFRSRNTVAHGADWADHYGKRNHDVDVEKV